MRQVKLYTKADCALCDEVAAMLAVLRPTYPHDLVTIDITQDPQLWAAYRLLIPVVQIGSQTLKAPLSLGQLRRALQEG